ncbi:MAG: FHA domain-containing protein [Candidatus Wallbacteria bacterium]|nr:FHA domain-containing protein [Candidatus Wallbacteria bacterium]
MARLIVRRGPRAGYSYPVDDKTVTIGRDPARTVPILDGKVSRLHAEIVPTAHGWMVRDLGATNKTYVNGRAVTEALLAFGDAISIGETEFVFEADEMDLPGPPDLTVVVTAESVPAGGVTLPMPQPGFEDFLPSAPAAESDELARRQARRLKVLWRVSRTAFVKSDLATFLEEILTLVLGELEADTAVFLLASEGAKLTPIVTHRARGASAEPAIVLTSTVVNRVFASGDALLVADAAKDLSGAASVRAQRISSVICVPLKSPEKTYGVFYMDRRSGGAWFDHEDLSFLATVCAHVAVNIENLALYQKQREAYERLKLAQEQLLASEKMSVLGRLAGSVAHELNNPLQCILMCSELLKDELRLRGTVVNPATALDQLEMVHHSVARCSRLVQNLLHYSHKGDTAGLVSLPLARPVSEAVKLMTYLVRKRGIEIATDLPPDLPSILGNGSELEQLFINLIKNSADAIPGKGNIAVSASLEPDCIEVRVTDSGGGIPPETLPHIFEELFTTKPIGEGTGLGLPLCKRIVENHGGTIEVESRVGAGTTVTVRFPLTGSASAVA